MHHWSTRTLQHLGKQRSSAAVAEGSSARRQRERERASLEVPYPTVPTANHRAAEKNIESIPPAYHFLPRPKHSIPNPICYLTCTAGLTTTNSKSTITRFLLPPNNTNTSHRFSSSILNVNHPIFFPLHVPHHHLHIFFGRQLSSTTIFTPFPHYNITEVKNGRRKGQVFRRQELRGQDLGGGGP